LPARDWFAAYAKRFRTVEVNNTFYRLPPPATFSGWRAQAPEGFIFALKVSQYGTHRRRLREPGQWLPNYLGRAVLLGERLGPNLLQLPPRWKRDTGRLREFFDFAAQSCAGLQATGTKPQIKWAVEFRDPTWLHESTFQVLRENGAALCCHDLLPDHPWLLTTGWAYARFHGPKAISMRYAGEYGEGGIEVPAKALREWLRQGCDVYAYFNNDMAGAAVRDAACMVRLLAWAPMTAVHSFVAFLATTDAPLDWVLGTAASVVFVGLIAVPAAAMNARDRRRRQQAEPNWGALGAGRTPAA
jgi:uncharacterized protein YecE (DUF72 family)